MPVLNLGTKYMLKSAGEDDDRASVMSGTSTSTCARGGGGRTGRVSTNGSVAADGEYTQPVLLSIIGGSTYSRTAAAATTAAGSATAGQPQHQQSHHLPHYTIHGAVVAAGGAGGVTHTSAAASASAAMGAGTGAGAVPRSPSLAGSLDVDPSCCEEDAASVTSTVSSTTRSHRANSAAGSVTSSNNASHNGGQGPSLQPKTNNSNSSMQGQNQQPHSTFSLGKVLTSVLAGTASSSSYSPTSHSASMMNLSSNAGHLAPASASASASASAPAHKSSGSYGPVPMLSFDENQIKKLSPIGRYTSERSYNISRFTPRDGAGGVSGGNTNNKGTLKSSSSPMHSQSSYTLRTPRLGATEKEQREADMFMVPGGGDRGAGRKDSDASSIYLPLDSGSHSSSFYHNSSSTAGGGGGGGNMIRINSRSLSGRDFSSTTSAAAAAAAIAATGAGGIGPDAQFGDTPFDSSSSHSAKLSAAGGRDKGLFKKTSFGQTRSGSFRSSAPFARLFLYGSVGMRGGANRAAGSTGPDEADDAEARERAEVVGDGAAYDVEDADEEDGEDALGLGLKHAAVTIPGIDEEGDDENEEDGMSIGGSSYHFGKLDKLTSGGSGSYKGGSSSSRKSMGTPPPPSNDSPASVGSGSKKRFWQGAKANSYKTKNSNNSSNNGKDRVPQGSGKKHGLKTDTLDSEDVLLTTTTSTDTAGRLLPGIASLASTSMSPKFGFGKSIKESASTTTAGGNVPAAPPALPGGTGMGSANSSPGMSRFERKFSIDIGEAESGRSGSYNLGAGGGGGGGGGMGDGGVGGGGGATEDDDYGDEYEYEYDEEQLCANDNMQEALKAAPLKTLGCNAADFLNRQQVRGLTYSDFSFLFFSFPFLLQLDCTTCFFKLFKYLLLYVK
jgi:hypothetical protein